MERQFRLVDRSGVLLTGKKRLRFEGVELSVCALGHVEHDNVRMELRGGVSIDRARGLMLKLGGK